MKYMLFMLLLLMSDKATAEWKAPEKPNPSAILNEAGDDARARRFEDALAKHVWFHEHALEHDDGQFGVRLSFALSDWHELGQVYPPAMERLKKTRDDATKRALEDAGKAAWNAFIDMRSINRVLGKDRKTVEVFEQLVEKKPEVATAVYGLAEPALIKAEKYELCGKYLEPTQTADRMVELYLLKLKSANDKSSPLPKSMLLQNAENSFTQESATLIALLALNKRGAEAEKIAERVRKESQNSDREKAIVAALNGELPKARGD
jgi:hypothetical protein